MTERQVQVWMQNVRKRKIKPIVQSNIVREMDPAKPIFKLEKVIPPINKA